MYPALRGRAARHDHARRPDPRRTLSKIGGKGLFVKELEVALAEGRADLAVHSLKDVPMELPPEASTCAAVMTREDPRDAFVSSALRALDDAAGRAPASARRACVANRMLRERFPHLRSSRCAATSTRGWPSSTAANSTRS